MHPDARTRRRHAVVAAVAAAALVGLHASAVHTSAGRGADTALLAFVGDLAGMPGSDVPATVAGRVRSGLPLVLALGVAALGVDAVRRRRWGPALSSAVLVTGSVVLSLALRDVLLPSPAGVPGTYPSTHVTAVVALCLAGARLRPTSWPLHGTRWAAAVLVTVGAVASVATHAHHPSDVLGSVLLVVTVSSLIDAAVVPAVRA